MPRMEKKITCFFLKPRLILDFNFNFRFGFWIWIFIFNLFLFPFIFILFPFILFPFILFPFIVFALSKQKRLALGNKNLAYRVILCIGTKEVIL